MNGMTMDYLVRRALRRHADRVAILDNGNELSYRDLDRRSDALAAYLLESGVRPGDRVALLLHNRSEFIETEIAILKCGAIKVPINNRLSVGEIIAILEDCEPVALFVEPEFENELLARSKEIPKVQTFISIDPVTTTSRNYQAIAGRKVSPPPPSPAAPEECYLLRYSGGTTARAKGILHSHAAGVSITLSAVREYTLKQSDVFLHVAHLSHGHNFIWPALVVQGCRLVMMRRFDPKQVLVNIETHGVTRLHMVPTMINAVFGHEEVDQHDLSSLDAIVYASAPMAPEKIRRLFDRVGPRVSQVYTLSESPVITTILSVNDHIAAVESGDASLLGSCGREALDVKIRIVGESFEELPTGEVGEVAISSPGNMMGYWRQPDLNALVMQNGWVLSGDLGWKDERGYLFLVDRRDDKIVTGGFNVYPKEVEEVLYSHSDVSEAAVVGIPDDVWGERIIAEVVLNDGAQCSDADLMSFCAERLAHYKRPKSITLRDDLPKSPVGKISRRQVREPYWSGIARRIN